MQKNTILIVGIVVCLVLAGVLVWMAKKATKPAPLPEVITPQPAPQAPTPPSPPQVTPPTPTAPTVEEKPTIESVEKDIQSLPNIESEAEIEDLLNQANQL